MAHSETIRAMGARLLQGLKAAVPALAVGACLAAASPAAASTILLDDGSMDHGRSVVIAGIGTVNAGPVLFHATSNGQPKDFVAWCVDVYHNISLKDYVPDLEYTDTNSLTNDFASTPHPLDAGDVTKVGLLVNYGQALYDTDLPVAPPAFTETAPKPWQFSKYSDYLAAKRAFDDRKKAHEIAVSAYNSILTTRYMRLAAVQSAIWQVVSNRNVTSSNHDNAFDLLVDNLSGNHLTDYFADGYDKNAKDFVLITPVQKFDRFNKPLKLTQSFAIATQVAVPEPGTWALMIVGLGATGAVLRRRRQTAAA